MSSIEEELEIQILIEQLIKEKEEFIKIRQQYLPRNIPIKRKEFQNNKLVKSDLKKSTTFVKKIKSINTEGIQQCIRDADTLNLTLYISEIVNAILATTFKAPDVSHVVKLCLSLHSKYDEFTEPLITGLKIALLQGSNNLASEEGGGGAGGEGGGGGGSASEAGKKRRIQIRFIIELYQAGLFNDDEFFFNLLKHLLGKSVSPSTSGKGGAAPAKGGMIDLQGLSTFVKYGSEVLFGLLPRKLLDLAKKASKPVNELPVKLLASAKNSTEMKQLLLDTYQMICTDLVEAHKSYRLKEHKFEKDRLIHGTLSEQKTQELEQAKKLYEKLLAVATTLAECTGENIPELKMEKFEEEGGGGISVWEGSVQGGNANEDSSGNAGLFDDPETRAFYEDLPDLLSLVPLSILGLSHEQAAALQEEWAAKEKQKGEEDNDNAITEQMTKMEQEIDAVASQDDGNEDLPEVENEHEGGAEEGKGDNSLSSKSNSAALTSDDTGIASTTNAAKLQDLLTVKILDCITKQKTDDFTVSFCYLSNNSKNARKRLAQTIAKIPRQRSDLAPFYGRIIASLHRIYPDILPIVVEALRKEFYGILRTKKQTFNIDHKVKNIRLQCELMKFRIIPPIIIFKMFKALLYDLSPHHIELLAAGLETCGRFLYLLRYTHETMEEILETMMRLRYAKRLDLYQQTLLESAYFAVKPPDRQLSALKKRERSVLEQYVRYLILETLDTNADEMSVDVTIKSLRRLPWNQLKETPIDHYLIKAALKLARTKYITIPNLADCISGLSKYYPNLLVQLVDRGLEEIQRAIEIPYKRDIQRIIGYTKLIGELYNFTAIPSTIIFDLLYHLIHYGHFNVQQYLVDTGLTDATSSINNLAGIAAHAGGGLLVPGLHFIPAGFTYTSPPYPYAMKYYDPRVPTEMDLPTDLFRTQIICELLNTCGLYYVRGQMKEKLTKYLIYFQRYLFTKQLIPLHIEFAILDTMDYLEEMAKEAFIEDNPVIVPTVPPKKGRGSFVAPILPPVEPLIIPVSFHRYDKYDEVQRIIDGFEQNQGGIVGNIGGKDEDEEELLERREKKVANLESQKKDAKSVEKKVSEDAVDEGEEGEDDEDGDDDEDDEDDDEDGDESEEDSSEDDSDDDDDDDEDSEQGEGEIEEDEEDEEQAARLLEKLRLVEQEDEEFEKAFKSVVQESISSVSAKHQDVNKMVIPAVLPKPKNTISTLDEENTPSAVAPAPPAVMKFSLLSRDGKGRVEARQLLVPKENPMAVKLAKAEEEARLEKLRIKERVLQLNSMNEDDYDIDDLGHDTKYVGYGNQTANLTSSGKSTGGVASTIGTVSDRSSASSSERVSNSSKATGGKIVVANYTTKVVKPRNAIRGEEVRKAPDTLNLDEFLAEANRAEIREIRRNTARKNN